MTDTVEFQIDDARRVMLEELEEEFGKEFIHNALGRSIRQQITTFYDNQGRLRQEKAAMEQRAEQAIEVLEEA